MALTQTNTGKLGAAVLFVCNCATRREIMNVLGGLMINLLITLILSNITYLFHTFFRLANGGECLFQASDDDEMSQWVAAITTVADTTGGASGSGRAQTLPAGQGPRDEPKKRSFFTLKKK